MTKITKIEEHLYNLLPELLTDSVGQRYNTIIGDGSDTTITATRIENKYGVTLVSGIDSNNEMVYCVNVDHLIKIGKPITLEHIIKIVSSSTTSKMPIFTLNGAFYIFCCEWEHNKCIYEQSEELQNRILSFIDTYNKCGSYNVYSTHLSNLIKCEIDENHYLCDEDNYR